LLGPCKISEAVLSCSGVTRSGTTGELPTPFPVLNLAENSGLFLRLNFYLKPKATRLLSQSAPTEPGCPDLCSGFANNTPNQRKYGSALKDQHGLSVAIAFDQRVISGRPVISHLGRLTDSRARVTRNLLSRQAAALKFVRTRQHLRLTDSPKARHSTIQGCISMKEKPGSCGRSSSGTL